MDPIKVIICDDHVLYRAGVKSALSSKKDIQIIAEADNGMHLLNMLKLISADVILLDIQMPIMDGITALSEIKRLYPTIKIIMLTMMDDHAMIAKLMEIGANSYLTKTYGIETIYEAIITCYEKEYYFTPETNKVLLANLSKKYSRPLNFSINELFVLGKLAKGKSLKDISMELIISTEALASLVRELQKKVSVKSIRELMSYAKQGDFGNADVGLSAKEIVILKLMCEEKSTREIADMIELSTRSIEAIRDKLKQKIGAKSTAGLIMYAVKHGLIEEDSDGYDSIVLNDDERKLLKLTFEEKGANEIAKSFRSSPELVDAIRDRLKSKTGTKSIAGLILYSLRNKLIPH